MLLNINWITEFVTYFNTYIYNEWSYTVYLLIPILIDTILGICIAICNKNFNFKKFWKIIDKIVLYLGILIIIKALSSFEPVEFGVFKWINIIAIVFIGLKELKSIIKSFKRFYEYLVAHTMIKQKLKEIQ